MVPFLAEKNKYLTGKSKFNVEAASTGRYPDCVRWFKQLPLLLFVVLPALGAEDATAKIIKVLPHLLDRDGRYSLSPSLYERDAYQALLRKNPEKCSGLRFDIQWKAKSMAGTQLELRLEIRGSKEAKPLVLEQPVERNHWYNRWSSLRVDGDDYLKLGEVIAWRATLWKGDRLAAEQKSFLW